jgi:hypothetical protein
MFRKAASTASTHQTHCFMFLSREFINTAAPDTYGNRNRRTIVALEKEVSALPQFLLSSVVLRHYTIFTQAGREANSQMKPNQVHEGAPWVR